jgi:peptidyl-prolyl cis-trans isomerase C
MPRERWILALLLMQAPLVAVGCKSCSEDALKPQEGAEASASGKVLSPELAAKVLAKVGEREITLGEFAASLERMDQFERLRYQSTERRKQLLDEMIKVELLAAEARRRGLDKRPETQERTRQILRDEMLRRTRDNLPAPAEIPETEVRAYYEKHRDQFREPERRRVAHIVVSDAAKAKRVVALAAKATPTEWGKLVQEHSLDKPPKNAPGVPLELAGDLGIVSAPGDKRGENPRVPEAVRKAVFEIDKLGGVLAEPVGDGGKFHIVRMTGRTEARERSLAEADRAIRVAILQARIKESEERMERELRGRYPVKIDEAALKQVALPAGSAQGAATSALPPQSQSPPPPPPPPPPAQQQGPARAAPPR